VHSSSLVVVGNLCGCVRLAICTVACWEEQLLVANLLDHGSPVDADARVHSTIDGRSSLFAVVQVQLGVSSGRDRDAWDGTL
jgi:hypothetical protein